MTSNIFSIINQGVEQFQAGHLDNAERLISTVLKLDPKNSDALQILGVIKNIKGEHAEGVRLLKKAIELNPSNGFIHLNLAKALSDTNKDFYALPHHQKAIHLMPENPNTWLNYGVSLVKLTRPQEALTIYENALKIHSRIPDLWTNLSGVLNELNRHNDAISAAQTALELDSRQSQAWCNLGSALSSVNKFSESLSAFNTALTISPKLLEGWVNRSKVLLSHNEIDEALRSCSQALEIDSKSAAAWLYMGNGFQAAQRFDESIVAYRKSLQIEPQSVATLTNLGVSLKLNKELEKAQKVFEDAITYDATVDYLLGNYLNVLMHLCNWRNIDSLIEKISSEILNGKNVIMPFDLLPASPDAKLQRRCSEIFVANKIQCSPFISLSKNSSGKRIRIGYFSYDFKEHPVGTLIEPVIASHNRSNFEVIGFFLNPPKNDPIETRLKQVFDKNIDLSGLSDSTSINLALEQNLDIAIDLNCHTGGARMSLFSPRLAPIQINYLGYAGTSGANYFDYVIADRISIDPEHQDGFTEKVAYLPNSFFPPNTEFLLKDLDEPPTRASQNLPERGFIFGCFNNAYKITPSIFNVWMNLLKNVPSSVLWLSQMPIKTIENLRSEAKLRGVNPDRLIFAVRTPNKKDHLNRLQLMDLFLDTPNYNAHATASDALSAGVPVLTVMGQTFAGRVAASQIAAADLPELITNTLEAYESKALAFASNTEDLSAIRTRLAANQKISPLFDMKKYVSNLESLYLSLSKGSSA